MSNKAAIIDWADIEVGFMSYAIEEVKPETVGQLLVIYDDVQYYENDIIKDWSGTRELKFEIMDDEQGCFLQLDDTDLCVLGNVFDNPELLG